MLRMNQNGLATATIVLIIAVVLAAGGAAAYFVTSGNGGDESQNATTQTDDSQQEQAQTQEETGDDSVELLKGALAGGDAVECTFMQNGYPGTVYVTSSANFRVDAESDEGKAYMIKKDDTAYIWMDGSNEGYSFSGEFYDEEFEERFDTFNPETFEEQSDASTAQNIDCARTNVDASLLELPEDVNFRSFSEIMQQVPDQSGN